MKICMVSTHPISGGGVSSYTKNLVQSLREHEVDVAVFSNKPRNKKLIQTCEGVYATWNKGILYPFQTFKMLANTSVDIVHVQHEFFLYGGVISAILFPVMLALIRLLHKPVVVTIHGVIPLSEMNERFKEENELDGPLPLLKLGLIFLTKTIVFLSDAVIVHGKFFLETLCNEYGCPKWKIYAIPLGVGKAVNMIPQNEAKKRLGLENKVIVFFFGYISKYKGIETLIEAFGRIAKEHPNLILIIGGGKHPRLRQSFKYEDYITKLQREARSSAPKQIMFTGFISNEKLPLYFSLADIMVFPYNIVMSSSAPLALSMCYGKPVIASDIPPFRELIPLGEALFKKNSSEDLIKKLQLMLNDRNLRDRIALYVRRVAECNSWSNVSLQTCNVFQNLCKPFNRNNEKVYHDTFQCFPVNNQSKASKGV